MISIPKVNTNVTNFFQFVPKDDPEETSALLRATEENKESEETEPEPSKFKMENEQEFAEFFANASYEELQEMADILGLTYQNDCEATSLKKYPDPEPNAADVNGIIKRVEDNDPDLDAVNFNNIKVSEGKLTQPLRFL